MAGCCASAAATVLLSVAGVAAVAGATFAAGAAGTGVVEQGDVGPADGQILPGICNIGDGQHRAGKSLAGIVGGCGSGTEHIGRRRTRDEGFGISGSGQRRSHIDRYDI